MKATYEDGVLKPTEPINLHEGAEVDLLLVSRERSPSQIIAEIAKLSRNKLNDGYSGRDHDKILYGRTDSDS